jgi:hypothetical protein
MKTLFKGDKKNSDEQCATCGIYTDSPNFAYHLCVKKCPKDEEIVSVFGALNCAKYFDITTQFVTDGTSVVVMSSREYRKLVKEELPNTIL